MGITSGFIKNVLIIIVFTILFLPFVQSNLHLFYVKDLKGFFTTAPNTELTKDGWLTTSYQEAKEKYLVENFGFRNTLIRLMNQLRFNLFKKTSNAETVIGKENYLYSKVYIESLKGENFIGNEEVIKKSLLVKELQTKLRQQGKIFLPVIAPNKAVFYREYLPEDVTPVSLTNYEAFKYCFNALKIDYIDFESYFLSIKKTSKYSLFPKYGIHWSTYGHTLAADSIIRYLNVVYGLKTNKFHYKDNMVLSDSLRDLDYDIGEGMNLFVDQLKSEKLAYPQYKFEKVSEDKPSLLTIGDSFNFGIQMTGVPNEVFSDYKLLYYFRELIPYSDDKDAFKKLNIKDEIENHQVILMLFTEQNFVNYGSGFIEKAIKILNGEDNGSFDEKENKILAMIKKIWKDEPWLAKIKTESQQKNLNLDSLVRQNAIYMVNLLDEERIKIRTTKINEMVSYIKTDDNWMKGLELKARETNIPLDTLILKDAIYQVDVNNKQ